MSGIDPTYARHVQEEFSTMEDLFAAGEYVEQLRQHPGWALVQTIVGAELSQVESELGRNRKPLEQAEYALKHGLLSGLAGAQAAADTIVGEAQRVYREQQEAHETAGSIPAGR